MARTGARVALVGATGALGSEVLAELDSSRLRLAELLPLATDRSLGQEIEFQGELYPVQTGARSLRGFDLALCCAPAAASLEWVREALRAEVPCIDCSGALLASPEVPARVAGLTAAAGAAQAPVVTAPAGAALAWAFVLAPLHEAAGLRRVSATVLDAASAAGRDAIEALSAGSLALFGQEEPPEPGPLGRPLAFDCWPSGGPYAEDGVAAREAEAVAGLRRVLGAELEMAVTIVDVPAFVGQACALAIETERPLEPKQARERLAAAPRVELWPDGADGPNLRAAAGRDAVIAGRLRRDPGAPQGLLLWTVADVLRLAAANAVALAAERLASR
jgi:aspartate-semialdehyde dehydrogenase